MAANLTPIAFASYVFLLSVLKHMPPTRSTRAQGACLPQQRTAQYTKTCHCLGWEGPFEIVQSNPPAQAGSFIAGCPGLRIVRWGTL